MTKILFVTAVAIFLISINIKAQQSKKKRVLILTDINNVGGDPDDKQSMAHLFLYANEIEISGIIPDYWNGKGTEASLQCIAAYEKDFNNPDYNFQKLNYPKPDSLRKQLCKTPKEAINKIIDEALKTDADPLHILVWGGMNTLKQALNKCPSICKNIHIYTIATHVMAENINAAQNSSDTVRYGIRDNWNGKGRNEIYNDVRFRKLWWLENDWAYNGMFEGEAPRRLLSEIKTFGALGYYIWEVVQPKNWAHYFRAGDTPTLLYLLEPGIDINNPETSSWAGKFVKPFPATRPNYWTDDAGTPDWDYENPQNSWNLAQQVYKYRVNSLLEKREEWYAEFREKLKQLYNNE